MNSHSLIDRLTVSTAGAAVKHFRFFKDSLDSPSLLEHIQNADLRLPMLNGEGRYELEAETLVGTLDPAFMVARWRGEGYPTIIHHHGNNERPFDMGLTSKNSFKNIYLTGRTPFPANLIALRAPFHTDLRVYMRQVSRLDHFAAMLAVSVRLVEALVPALRAKTGAEVIVTGISLGGWVTNLHKALYDSADRYIPMLAGAALDEVFTKSTYSRLAGENVQAEPERVHQVLNFEEAYRNVDLSNVFPLLGRYDSIIEYERQAGSYRDRPVRVLDKGHTTSAVAFADLRRHVVDSMEDRLPAR